MDVKLNSSLTKPGVITPQALALKSFDVSRDLIRLDDAIEASPDPVRQGWLRRAVIYETAASLRLDGIHVPAQDLLFGLNQISTREPQLDLVRAMEIHRFFSALLRRNPERIFN